MDCSCEIPVVSPECLRVKNAYLMLHRHLPLQWQQGSPALPSLQSALPDAPSPGQFRRVRFVVYFSSSCLPCYNRFCAFTFVFVFVFPVLPFLTLLFLGGVPFKPF